MLRLANIKMTLDMDDSSIRSEIIRRLKIKPDDLKGFTLVKKSVDARDKADVHFVITVDAAVANESSVLKRLKRGVAEIAPIKKTLPIPEHKFKKRPVVIGSGPAGLFAALTLAKSGAFPIVLERGKKVNERALDIQAMRQEGILHPDSNVQFGQGGAGTFSDGKLTTGIKSPHQRTVLETLVAHGAPDDILYEQKPHIGTDILIHVVAAIRNTIISLGGQFLFESRMTELIVNGEHIEGIKYQHKDETHQILTDTVLLAIGHSARDTVHNLFRQGIMMAQKPFAMGVRIEHPQDMINRSQYGRFASHPALNAAPYKLNVRTPDERGVYTFCMCPGGQVMPASSEPEGLCVNGMSYRARNGQNANSALLVGIKTEDFVDDHPLSGIVLQRAIEHAAYRAGGGKYIAPAQRVEDFLCNRETKAFGDVTPTYRPGVVGCDLRSILPPFMIQNMQLAIPQLDRQLKGFALPDAVLTGVEARSSSPVRILRDQTMMANLSGLFPVGEGAGYAGGIVSAAVDGINAAYAALERSHLL